MREGLNWYEVMELNPGMAILKHGDLIVLYVRVVLCHCHCRASHSPLSPRGEWSHPQCIQ